MAIRIPVKKVPDKNEVLEVQKIVERSCDPRWSSYAIFKGMTMLELGYSISEIEASLSNGNIKV